MWYRSWGQVSTSHESDYFNESESQLLAAGENFPFVADEKVTARRPRTGRGG